MLLHMSVILFTDWVSQYALQVVSQHALQQVSGGGIPACLAGFQANTRGGGKLRGIWPGGSPGPHQGGLHAHTWRFSRPTPGGVAIPACTEADPPTATAAGGKHPTGMHSCDIM